MGRDQEKRFPEDDRRHRQTIAGLQKNYQARLKTDPTLKRYEQDTEELRKSFSDTKVSLNETKRKAEMDEAQKKKAQLESLDTKLTSKEGLSTDDLTKMKDEYLRESLLLLADLVTKHIG